MTILDTVSMGFDPKSITTSIGPNTIASTVSSTSSVLSTNVTSAADVLELVQDNLVVRSVDINDVSLLDVVDSKNEIKKKLAEQLTIDVLNKVTFTKQENYFNCSTTVRGRVYVFSEIELKKLIKQLTR